MVTILLLIGMVINIIFDSAYTSLVLATVSISIMLGITRITICDYFTRIKEPYIIIYKQLTPEKIKKCKQDENCMDILDTSALKCGGETK
ncbi:MAG: hypothetical protein AB7P94_17245 [Steroidobacteraceae bacterium]